MTYRHRDGNVLKEGFVKQLMFNETILTQLPTGRRYLRVHDSGKIHYFYSLYGNIPTPMSNGAKILNMRGQISSIGVADKEPFSTHNNYFNFTHGLIRTVAVFTVNDDNPEEITQWATAIATAITNANTPVDTGTTTSSSSGTMPSSS
tara:strand:- start:22 stop:465 length:444 start_codon:yes stop_codon:yes gene_type:complete